MYNKMYHISNRIEHCIMLAHKTITYFVCYNSKGMSTIYQSCKNIIERILNIFKCGALSLNISE